MDTSDREQTLKELLDAGTATRVEQVLDDAGIRLERGDLDLDQIQEFWRQLHDALDPATLDQNSNLAFHRLVSYARAALQARANR